MIAQRPRARRYRRRSPPGSSMRKQAAHRVTKLEVSAGEQAEHMLAIRQDTQGRISDGDTAHSFGRLLGMKQVEVQDSVFICVQQMKPGPAAVNVQPRRVIRLRERAARMVQCPIAVPDADSAFRAGGRDHDAALGLDACEGSDAASMQVGCGCLAHVRDGPRVHAGVRRGDDVGTPAPVPAQLDVRYRFR